MRKHIRFNCGVGQRSARVAHNHQVVGSNPAPATTSPEAACRALPVDTPSLATGQGGHECPRPMTATGSAVAGFYSRGSA